MRIDPDYPDPLTIIGLMSGTSADGIDAAVMEIGRIDSGVQWRLLQHCHTPWPQPLRGAILSACAADAPVSFITALNFRLGEWFASAALAAASSAGLPLDRIDAVASHGQTIRHQPASVKIGDGLAAGTLQIGEPAVIAARTGRLVVADFRPADMAVGGQGAPLVPFADHALFANRNETRAVQNIGGIANVTYLPAGGALSGVRAFDTGPGNMVIDAITARITEGRCQFDEGGQIAQSGSVVRKLLQELLEHPYFRQAPPKTTGREEFGEAYAERVYTTARARHIRPNDLLATITALTAESILLAYRNHLCDGRRPQEVIHRVIVGGGGTRNLALMNMLRSALSPVPLECHAEHGMPDQAKEAAAFALLGYATLRGMASNVPSATGARRGAVLGKICLPPI